MRVGNTILIVLLTVGLLSAATFFALKDTPTQPAGPTVDFLIVQLANGDEQVSKEAELALLGLGSEAIPYLDRASRSSDRILASRARRLLKQIVDPSTGVE